MILPEYKLEILHKCKSQMQYKIIFDRITVFGSCDSKYSIGSLVIRIKECYHRRNVNLLKYLIAINDFLISNNYIGEYAGKYIDMFSSNIIKTIDICNLKITSGEMEYINDTFPNLVTLTTNRCTIYDKASIGVLNCAYIDNESYLTTLDSFNGFSGRAIRLRNTKIMNQNKHTLHLNCEIMELINLDIDYKTFILMLDASKLRKFVIHNRKPLNDSDLIFISGLYNLESIEMNAKINSLDQINKLERLRNIEGIFLNDSILNEKAKKKCSDVIDEYEISGEELDNYLMFQSMLKYNKYLDLLNKLYVKRIDRVNYENKINENDLEKIKKDLLTISKMSFADRKKIAKEIKDYDMRDDLDGLYFDKHPFLEEEEVLMNSRLFDSDGIQYYVKRKHIVLD